MTLRQALPGGWLLESFVSRRDGTGPVRYPFGEHPSGLILYTTDGHMSAQLTPGTGEFVSYGGRFEVDEAAATVTHHVIIATMPELLLEPLIRHARVEDDRLTLSARQTTDEGAIHSTLVWRRDG